MKGPGLRIDQHDVRRVWECPRCGRRTKATGDVVSRSCRCQPGGTFMKLLEEAPVSTSSASGSPNRAEATASESPHAPPQGQVPSSDGTDAPASAPASDDTPSAEGEPSDREDLADDSH